MYIITAIIAGILGGIFSLFSKTIIESDINSKTYTLLWTAAAAIIFGMVLIFNLPNISSISLIGIILLIFAGLCYSISNSLIFKAFRTLELSKYSIINPVTIIAALFGAVIVLHEKVSLIDGFGITAIFIGIIITFYQRGYSNSYKDGSMLALASAFITGAASIFNKLALLYATPILVVIFTNYFFQIPFVLNRQTAREALIVFKKFPYKIIIGGIIAAASWGLYVYSLKIGNVSVVQPINNTLYIVTQSILGMIILNERKDVLKKIIGLGVCILGIVLINI